MKHNVTIVTFTLTPNTLISRNNKARILNTLFKVKLRALVEQLLALLKWNFADTFFVGGILREMFFQFF